MPEISVIVPVYKVEKYLADCVSKSDGADFQDIEIILVDDGSPDRCGVLCDKLAEKDSRIRVIHQSNQGLSCARNSGVKAAIGRYICFVDSDDLVAPDYCQVYWNCWRKPIMTSASVVSTGSLMAPHLYQKTMREQLWLVTSNI